MRWVIGAPLVEIIPIKWLVAFRLLDTKPLSNLIWRSRTKTYVAPWKCPTYYVFIPLIMSRTPVRVALYTDPLFHLRPTLRLGIQMSNILLLGINFHIYMGDIWALFGNFTFTAKCHGCCWPGEARSFDLVLLDRSGLSIRRATRIDSGKQIRATFEQTTPIVWCKLRLKAKIRFPRINHSSRKWSHSLGFADHVESFIWEYLHTYMFILFRNSNTAKLWSTISYTCRVMKLIFVNFWRFWFFMHVVAINQQSRFIQYYESQK